MPTLCEQRAIAVATATVAALGWITVNGRHILIGEDAGKGSGDARGKALTDNERAAVVLWKSGGEPMRDIKVASAGNVMGTANVNLKNFEAALNKLPRFKGTLWRAVARTPAEIKAFKAGATMDFASYKAASKSEETAKDFGRFRAKNLRVVLFKLEVGHGFDIEKVGPKVYEYQQEVVIPPSKFKIESVKKGTIPGASPAGSNPNPDVGGKPFEALFVTARQLPLTGK